jgi:hypothetical protein
MRCGQRTLLPQSRKRVQCQNLALGDDLMFHQNDARRRMEQTLW